MKVSVQFVHPKLKKTHGEFGERGSIRLGHLSHDSAFDGNLSNSREDPKLRDFDKAWSIRNLIRGCDSSLPC